MHHKGSGCQRPTWRSHVRPLWEDKILDKLQVILLIGLAIHTDIKLYNYSATLVRTGSGGRRQHLHVKHLCPGCKWETQCMCLQSTSLAHCPSSPKAISTCLFQVTIHIVEVDAGSRRRNWQIRWSCSSAVRSRTSLWRMIGNPPVGQYRAWSMVNYLPQAHVVGNSGGCHPYLKQIASHKALLWSVNPWLSIGSATNQLDEPFFFAMFISF